MPNNIRFRRPHDRRSEGPTRIVQTISQGRYVVDEFPLAEVRKIARFRNAERVFLRTGNENLLNPYRDRGVTTTGGTYWPFEVSPNVLYELREMDAPQFHEIYEDPQDGGY